MVDGRSQAEQTGVRAVSLTSGCGLSAPTRPLADPLVELVARRFRVLGHPVRIGMIDRLDRLGEAHVQALADELAATQQNTSKHLGALRRAGMVARRREGRVTVYSLADREAFPLIERAASEIAVQLRERAEEGSKGSSSWSGS